MSDLARPAPVTHRQAPDFLIVGTPRSGTTLAQRLACDIPGVGMPPETHFFGFFALDMFDRSCFPLVGRALRRELQAFATTEKSLELGIDLDSLQSDLGGRCETAIEMFGAIVRQLAGSADTYGEKSPEHLLWWRPLSQVMPWLKVIVVVRDPRSVVASMLQSWGADDGWGVDPCVIRAERWSSDQRQAMAAMNLLGPSRCLVLRYEDMVANPERCRGRMADFLGIDLTRVSNRRSHNKTRRLVLPREMRWKARIFEGITTERVTSWRSSLSERQAARITSVCRKEMRSFGYSDDLPGAIVAAARLAWLNPRTQWRRLRFRLGRARFLMKVQAAPIAPKSRAISVPIFVRIRRKEEPSCS